MNRKELVMFDIDKWQEIYSTIRKNKLRTILTGLGVAWGIGMLVILLGSGRGFENGIEGQFDVAKNAIFVWGQRTSMAYKGLQPGRFVQFNNDDVDAIRNNIPELAVVAPRLNLGGSFAVVYEQKSASYEVYGDYPDFFKVRPYSMIQGRYINEKDIQDRRKVAVIGTTVKDVLFGKDENPVGKYIKIRGIPFLVIGVYTMRSTQAEEVMQASKEIFVCNTALQQTFNLVNKIGWFAFVPKQGVPAAGVEQKIKRLLASRHRIHPDDIRAIGSANVEEEYMQVQGLFMIIRSFSWFVSIFTIIAGVIGVGNIMLIVVKERTKEIGIRKALGATPWSIISMILQETIVITTVAGYMGLLASTGIIAGINYLLKKNNAEGGFFANPEVDLTMALTATAVLIIGGALIGMVPATKAAAVDPVVALRDE
ncbi:ABC transporter permease [Xanthocytophaga agilis]|uniref:ABC transporter permease n=1 Tax=Xanthocytophaga agilis TaxID=3048010 RepID=A0AAE3QWX4_9BACT|nr:ABC transporter permease [Xanthocytophaga agilis]MDJ1499556.1 ABC transporter permease [Xanthocytophaga agilis]